MLLLICGDLALNGLPSAVNLATAIARWILGGIVYGLAAAGLYSQTRQIGTDT